MKLSRFLSAIISMTLVSVSTNFLPPQNVSATTETILLGDVSDGDGVTAKDALWIQRYLRGEVTATPRQLTAMDINEDGVIDNTDVQTLLFKIGNGGGFSYVSKELYTVPNNATMTYYKHNCSSTDTSQYTQYTIQAATNYPVSTTNASTINSPINLGDDELDNENIECVELVMVDSNNNTYIGSGIVVDNNVIATAAHCLFSGNKFMKSVTINFYNEDCTELEFSTTAKNIHIPANYASSGKASHCGQMTAVSTEVVTEINRARTISMSTATKTAEAAALFIVIGNFMDIIDVSAEEIDDDDIYEEKVDDAVNEIKNEQKKYEDSQKQYQRDPLIINFSGKQEIEFTSLNDGVNFDLDNNGFAEKTAWIKNDDGFLAIDLNNDGMINNGGELFGDCFNNQSFSNGFEALKGLDSNRDNKIDDTDSPLITKSDGFNHEDETHTLLDDLVVWFDYNHNGITDDNETKSLKSLNVDYIDLNCFNDQYNDENDKDHVNSARREETSYVYFTDGTARKNISEFWFDMG